MSKDYYKILGVDKNSSEAEIKAAFRKLAHEHHPDKAGGNEAKFKEINEAYQVLGNKEKRQQYDQFGADFDQQGGFGAGMGWEDFMRAARGGPSTGSGQGGFNNIKFDFGGADLGDMFGDIFSNFGFGSSRSSRSSQKQRGDDIQVDYKLDLFEAFSGVKKQVELYKDVKCPHCHGNLAEPGAKIVTCKTCGGQGQVSETQRTMFGVFQTATVCPGCLGQGKVPEQKCKECKGQGVVRKKELINIEIPAGVEDGMTLKMSGHGQAGSFGAGAGDLYINLRVKNNSEFERHGNDLVSKQKISFKQAALGAEIEIKTIDGTVEMKIPAGTQPNTRFRLKGKGMPHLNSNGRGDMYVIVDVEVPTKLSRKQRQILEEFEE
ncbi:MAG: molecular chaperone DnaJ [Parcubacteria group bacterium]